MTITKQNRHIDRHLDSIRNSYDVFDERLHNLPQQNLFQMRNILSSFRRSLVCVKMQIKSKSLPNKIFPIQRKGHILVQIVSVSNGGVLFKCNDST